jgi:hypothetical protein
MHPLAMLQVSNDKPYFQDRLDAAAASVCTEGDHVLIHAGGQAPGFRPSGPLLRGPARPNLTKVQQLHSTFSWSKLVLLLWPDFNEQAGDPP